jgi:ATP-binding protein involved in chromosome partitioning
MSGMTCPSCGERISLFPTVSPPRAIWQMEVEKLGEIPFTAGLGEAAEAGVPLAISAPDSATARAFTAIAERVVSRLA